MKLSEMTNETSRSTNLWTGSPGSGKTIAGCSFAISEDPRPIYVYDLDGRMKPVLEYYKNYPQIIEKIEYDTYTPNRKSFEDLYKHMEKLANQPVCDYKLIMVDSLTALGDTSIRYSRDLAGSASGKKKGLIFVPGLEDYGVEASIISQVVDALRNAKCDIILTAHYVVVDEKLASGEMYTVRQLLTGGKKIAAKVPAYFDEHYFFNVENSADEKYGMPKFKAYTATTGPMQAKTALGLPKEIDWTGKLFYREIERLKGTNKVAPLAIL